MSVLLTLEARLIWLILSMYLALQHTSSGLALQIQKLGFVPPLNSRNARNGCICFAEREWSPVPRKTTAYSRGIRDFLSDPLSSITRDLRPDR